MASFIRQVRSGKQSPKRLEGRQLRAIALRVVLSLVAVVMAGLVFAGGVWIKQKNLLPDPGPGVPETRFVEPEAVAEVSDLGPFAKWSKVEIELQGPQTSVMDAERNPSEIVVDVTFEGPDGRRVVVPAFYDGDGEGGYTGDVWKVRFRPDAVGRWQFSTQSTVASLGGHRGAFMVEEPEGCEPRVAPGGLPDFACVGRLQYEPGQHYLKFADGGYWIKGGIDDPENFLGEAIGDWSEKREAIDILRDHGVNSIYFITNNITPGDRNDTWPWMGETAEEAKENVERYDVVKLQAWEDFFEYVQEQGIVLHFILADDSAWSEFEHYPYYREMVARFAHHPGLIWNIGEEANEVYWDSDQLELAQLLRDLDPFDNPVTVHRKPPWPFMGETVFDLTSIQPGDGAGDFGAVIDTDLGRIVREHRIGSVEEGHPIPVMIDETPRVRRVDDETRFIMRSQILYPIYLSGGNYELHYHDSYGQGGSLRIEELTPMLQDMQVARQFVESVPFHEMAPCNELVAGVEDRHCLGKAGEVYLLYFVSLTGEALQVDLSEMSGDVSLQWFDPRTGAISDPEPVEEERTLMLNVPDGREAGVILRRVGP